MTNLERMSALMVAAKMVGNSLGTLASDAVHVKHLERCMERPFIDDEHKKMEALICEALASNRNEPSETKALANLKAGLRVVLDYLERA